MHIKFQENSDVSRLFFAGAVDMIEEAMKKTKLPVSNEGLKVDAIPDEKIKAQETTSYSSPIHLAN